MSVTETVLFPLNWLLKYTLYYILSGIFWVVGKILPTTYTYVLTEYKDIFYNGIVTTLELSIFGTILGFLIACVLGTLRTIKVKKSDNKFVKVVKTVVDFIIRIYVTIFRGTPMIVQAMIIYYGVYKFTGWKAIDAAMFTVTVNTGAYLTEVIRSSIESIDKGQMEGARSLGFSFFKSLILIVFPQAIKNCMSSIGNELVINIKDTSVLNVIGCVEMYYVLNMSSGKTFNFMETMITGALVYLLLTYTATKILNAIEKRLDAPIKPLPGSN